MLERPRTGHCRVMGILSKITKAGIAKKVVDQARKPENQRKIKDAVSKMSDKRKGGRTGH